MYTVNAKGRACHSLMPELGINAITTITDFVTKVQAKFDEITNDEKYQNADLGSTLNVFSMIEGGIQFNSVPENASVSGNIRTVPEFGSEQSIKVLEDSIEENNKDDSKAKLSLELIQVLDPALASKENDLINSLKESAKDKNIVVKALIGTCELSRYIHIRDDIQLLVYGPGVTKTAHIVDEYVELDEYGENVRIFKDTCLRFLER